MKSGDSIGGYQIVAALGAGGMGEVWRATDTNLGREVAIKLLPGDFADDDDRHARFEREARLLASLNHPNIATLYGLEHLAGQHALIMELVDGESLDQTIARGPIAIGDAIQIALQMTRALEAAHSHGIVHRDLKPANVMIRPDGTVKVLDFGLAKTWAADGSASDPSLSPTMTRHATVEGVILGTAAYMSPEQARGKPVDKRADIWAFGVVLWEMLTGEKLFAGETVSDTLAGVLKTEIDFTEVPAETPSAIVRLLRRCLERNPTNRLHDIADARIRIDEALSTADEPDTPETAIATSRGLGMGPAIVVLVFVAALAAYLGRLTNRPQPEPREPHHLVVELAPSRELMVGGNGQLAFSPDGRSLVFSAFEEGQLMLFRRRLSEPTATAIPGTEGGRSPFFSPDGSWLGFTANGNLQKVPIEGGRPLQLADARGAGGGVWLSDNTIIYAPIYSDGLFQMSAEGGSPTRLTTPDRTQHVLGHWWPRVLPGERRILFTAFRTPVDQSRIGVLDLDTGEVHWVVEGGFFARYLPGGQLLFARGQRLYAVAFDTENLRTIGQAKAVIDDLSVDQTNGDAMFSVSSQGMLAFVTGTLGHPLRQLVWIDRDGVSSPAIEQRGAYVSVCLSPDDSRAALTIQGESRDLWTYSFARGTLSRLTTASDTEFDPIWGPGGSDLIYVVDRPPFTLYQIAAGVPDSGHPVWEDANQYVDTTRPALSPDGSTLMFTQTENETASNLYWRPVDGSETARPYRVTRAQEDNASFSPDGRWITYQADDTGRTEIYVEAFPGPGERSQISANGGTDPIWGRNGDIFYRNGVEQWVVETRRSDHFSFDTPRLLFKYPIVPDANTQTRTYDVSRDGKLFLAIAIPEASRPRQIEIVTDWTGELEKLVPGGAR